MSVAFGGALLRVQDPEALYAWYERHLGLVREHGSFVFPPGAARADVVLAFVGPEDDTVPSRQPVVLNLQVDDLDALLDRLSAEGVEVDPERAGYPFGRFGWIVDPGGNRVELWEPAEGAAAEGAEG